MAETKRCIQCGAVLPEDAAFCPHCTATQVARQVRAVPRRRSWRKMALLGVGTLAALAVGGWALWGQEKPAAQEMVLPTVTAANMYDRQCQTYYEGADGELYWVFAAFSPAGGDGENCPNGYRSQLIAAGEESWGPLTLYAYDAVTGKNAREAFAALVESWQVTASAQEGDGCRIVMEDADYSAGGAMYAREHIATSLCGRNEITWTLHMRNGDTVTLTQVEEYGERPAVDYRWENEDMTTPTALQALLDRAAEETEPEDVVTVYLPTVTYDQPLHVRRDMNLIGDDTVIAGGLVVEPLVYGEDKEVCVNVRDVTFAGDGGVGLQVMGPTWVRGCRFTGWDVAAQALDGGWICSQENTYDSNGVALELDSGSAMLCGSNMNNSRFLRNGVAIRVKRLPVEWMTLELYDCSFYGNTVDLDDPQGLVVRR